jgi:hypothetical protein
LARFSLIGCVFLYGRLLWVRMGAWRVWYLAFIHDEDDASSGLRVCRGGLRTGSSTPFLPEMDTFLQA